MKAIFQNWKVSETGIMCSNHPTLGGIIDKAIVSGKWFVVFNDEIDLIEGLESIEDAKEAFVTAIRKKAAA